MQKQRGFTLIELLVVIAILSLLVVSFLPDLGNAKESARKTATGALLIQLQNGIRPFETKTGFYPPDDFQDPEKKLQLKPDNGINTAIESLLVFLAVSRTGMNIDDLDTNLGNTDSDDLGGNVPGLNSTKRQEIVDAWGTPLAYFSKTGAGFAKSQRIQLSQDQGGEVVEAKAWTVDGKPLGSGKYQLVSAGPDRKFNTDDDITLPERN